MESLPAIWLGAAVISASSAFAGFGEVNLLLALAAMINLMFLLGLRRTSPRSWRDLPRRPKRQFGHVADRLQMAEDDPDHSQQSIRPELRFGGLDPDLLQSHLVSKMMKLERLTAQSAIERF